MAKLTEASLERLNFYKSKFRRSVIRELKSVSRTSRKEQSKIVAERIRQMRWYQNATKIGFHLEPFSFNQKEPGIATETLIRMAFLDKKRVFLPRLIPLSLLHHSDRDAFLIMQRKLVRKQTNYIPFTVLSMAEVPSFSYVHSMAQQKRTTLPVDFSLIPTLNNGEILAGESRINPDAQERVSTAEWNIDDNHTDAMSANITLMEAQKLFQNIDQKEYSYPLKVEREPLEAGILPILDMMIVPGLAYNLNCRRLGFGDGLYDNLINLYIARSVLYKERLPYFGKLRNSSTM
ncbi:uncharacterized protein V1516DRAFT_677850 [Lipomyces oligophaga]|uniref:uncharacterized protein n=1 Tax=Lipomyces oligophaga TaxID=45792 RepID=UPI0034CDCF67